MDVQQARAFRERWQAVKAVEIEEQRRASVSQRWQQMNAILRMAMGLGVSFNQGDPEEESVWRRWAQLKGL